MLTRRVDLECTHIIHSSLSFECFRFDLPTRLFRACTLASASSTAPRLNLREEGKPRRDTLREAENAVREPSGVCAPSQWGDTM